MTTIQWLINHFGLEELPVEGGIFTQTYLSNETIPAAALPPRYTADKPLATAILYLLTPDAGSFSAMHKLPTDEIYHFYLGDPVEMLQLYPDGRSERVFLGHDLMNSQHVQYTAARDVWQGSHLKAGGRFALVGTTMAPGFTHDDYVGGERDQLLEQYPDQADLIRQLTRPGKQLHMDG